MTHDEKIEILLKEKKIIRDRLLNSKSDRKDLRKYTMLIGMINEFIIDEKINNKNGKNEGNQKM